ncbi:MAG: SRPBCC domain-containing protein [Planctomycetes bacterium]|nr:SRPBCC domain-containing protein [Planctomycetota bacterium]
MDKIISQRVSLRCPAERAFDLFTRSEHLTKWLCEAADVEARPGGKYELFWDPAHPEENSTLGCRVLALESPHLLVFEWKGPVHLSRVMNERRPLTTVSVFVVPRAQGSEVHLVHTGWGETPPWEEAREWFVRAWDEALRRLQEYVGA